MQSKKTSSETLTLHRDFKLSKKLKAELLEVCRQARTIKGGGARRRLIDACGRRWVAICKRNLSVFKCDELQLVVKRFGFVMNPKTPLKVRVPTIRLNHDCVVQPVVIKINIKLAQKLICEQLPKDFECDLHCFNVGWIDAGSKMVPVMFDW